MRLIDADALDSALLTEGLASALIGYPRRRKLTVGEVRGILQRAPTIDPVKHGKWIFKGTSTDGKKVYECSACHADIYAIGIFCKECGARMDGEV